MNLEFPTNRKYPVAMFDVSVLPELDADTRRSIETLGLLAEGADGFASLSDHQRLQLQFGEPGEFTAIIARDGRRLAGYGHLTMMSGAWTLQIITHPNRRFEGVEKVITETAYQLVSESGGGTFTLWRFHTSFADDVLASELSLAPGRDLYQMRCVFPRKEKAMWPLGITVRTFDPDEDVDAWLAANARIFTDHPEQSKIDAEAFERRMRAPWFDPTGFLIAVDESGTIAGFCWTKEHVAHGLGEIYAIGVDPEKRASGLGRALVLAGLEHLGGRGMPLGMLYVDAANEAAIELYNLLGFSEHHRDCAYTNTI
jgi:mycothiol synthase